MRGWFKGRILYKFGSVILLLLAIHFIVVIIGIYTSKRLSGDAAGINYSGTVRMRSFKIGFLLNRMKDVSEGERLNYKLDIAKEMKLLEEILYGLKDGSLQYGLPGVKDRKILNQLNMVVGEWEDLMSPLLKRIIDTTDPDEAKVLISEYNNKVIDYVASVNKTVQLLEMESEAKVALLNRVEYLLLIPAVSASVFALIMVFILIERPIASSVYTMKRVKEGDLDARIEIRTGDEMQDLADGFNEMVKRIARHERELEKLIEERTKQLKEAHEELLRKERLAVMGQMAGGVAHEIRNPLAGIRGAIYVLKQEFKESNGRIKKYLDLMEQGIDTTNKIVEDLIGFSRMKPPDRQETGIDGLISEVLESTRPPDNIRVKVDLEKNLPNVYIDRIQIRQVFSNLISNAIQAMQNGGELTIKASLGEIGSETKYLDISFTDTGCGIPRENLDKIFQPLFTTKVKGIGLGLVVSKWFVEANGGMIGVDSKEGKGTTFNISLPTLSLNQP